jgi:hypothetical protein
MKHIKFLSLLFISLCIISCSDSESSSELPACIEDRSTVFQTEQANCSNASIKKYMYQEIEVYAFADGECISDGGVFVVDDGCSEICLLGGIAGFTDCNGEDFETGATLVEVIWENN